MRVAKQQRMLRGEAVRNDTARARAATKPVLRWPGNRVSALADCFSPPVQDVIPTCASSRHETNSQHERV